MKYILLPIDKNGRGFFNLDQVKSICFHAEEFPCDQRGYASHIYFCRISIGDCQYDVDGDFKLFLRFKEFLENDDIYFRFKDGRDDEKEFAYFSPD